MYVCMYICLCGHIHKHQQTCMYTHNHQHLSQGATCTRPPCTQASTASSSSAAAPSRSCRGWCVKLRRFCLALYFLFDIYMWRCTSNSCNSIHQPSPTLPSIPGLSRRQEGGLRRNLLPDIRTPPRAVAALAPQEEDRCVFTPCPVCVWFG